VALAARPNQTTTHARTQVLSVLVLIRNGWPREKRVKVAAGLSPALESASLVEQLRQIRSGLKSLP
jgi:hypothetical protein